jgi:LPXTG-motif cell wall-anchored protein
MPKLRRLTAAVTAGALITLYGGATYASAAIVDQEGDQTITADLSASQLANPLVGDGVEISNAGYTGSNLAAGTFEGFEDVLGFDSGVALSTGSVIDSDDFLVGGDGGAASSSFQGPNEHAGNSGRLLEPGTTDDTFDGSTLEFDFVAESSQLKLDYVFAAEDYPRYLNESWSDLFSIEVNGENCALVPGTETAVSTTSINAKTNADHFRNNANGNLNTELDGLTTVLSCTADVAPGEENHLKVSLADVGDDLFDTTVLLAAESLKVNQPPTADDVEATTNEDTPVDITLTGEDPEGSDLSFESASDPDHGTVEVEGDTATYTPDKNFSGEDTFTYVSDDGGLTSEEATVTVKVKPVNDAPKAIGSDYDTVIDEPVEVTLDGSDPENDDLTFAIAGDPENGELSEVDGDKVTYTPGPNFTGEDSFTFTANDGELDSKPATVNINVKEPNNGPSAADDSYSTDFETELNVDAPGVLDNDSDPDGDDLTAEVADGPENGDLELNADGSFTYTPDNGFSGEDTFTYVANDGQGDATAMSTKGNKETKAISDEATVTITVNDEPSDEPSDDPTDEPTEEPTAPPSDEPTESAPPADDDTEGGLPDTGSDVSPMMIAWGLMALVAGAGTLIAARKLR